MRLSYLFPYLALPVFVLAQSAQVTTSWVVQQTVGSNQQTSTISTPTVITIGPTTSLTSSGSASPTGNSTTASGSGSGNATSTTVASSNLPTAPTSVAGANGGGSGGGAPSPGASAAGGIYGPPDGYIAGAEALRSATVLGGIGFAVGVALTFA
ncbi:hypothetical protein F5J12DRAFT_836239 [Pisolithus orientalis]|uniref:uncharacterized protein n=1 Tax=Pisolithus orientalis TaxID=936130 RepID=UPI002225B4C9|nr:uncharacterized protein F5J12DRAFT_836239 [Pisolithus orientalis]KAI6005342.1 hypothetical protein F5J12DRAFT_836239 [Pisolithus orientalis]